MTKTVILDTHVLYDIGMNRVDIKDIRQPGDRLCYTPISVIELVSKLDDWSFDDRKTVAGAILLNGIVELPDPESYLTTTFGYKLSEPAPSYADAVLALAEGQSLDEIRKGVPDYGNSVRRTLNVPFAATWRDKGEQEWVDSLIHLMEENIPGFRNWYATNSGTRSASVPRLRGEQKRHFLAGMRSREWFAQVIAGCQMRAFFNAETGKLGGIAGKKVDDLVAAIPRIECYSHIYTQYLIRLMTEGLLPRKNDSGDIDLFLYSIDDDHIVATNEKKWIALAEAAGFTRRLRTYRYALGDAEREKHRKCPDEEAARYRIMCDAAKYCEMNFEDYVATALAGEPNHVMEEAATYRERTFEEYIETRPGVRGGKPCFTGTRMAVQDVLDYLAEGMTEAELLRDFPNLTKQHILAARDYFYAHRLHPASGSTA